MAGGAFFVATASTIWSGSQMFSRRMNVYALANQQPADDSIGEVQRRASQLTVTSLRKLGRYKATSQNYPPG
jgi:hypothetical protein